MHLRLFSLPGGVFGCLLLAMFVFGVGPVDAQNCWGEGLLLTRSCPFEGDGEANDDH